MKKLTLEEKLRMAIRMTITRHRLFTQIIASLEKRPTLTETETMATDGKTLYWNPAFVEWCEINELAWVILHEAGHIFLGHMNRFRDQQKTAPDRCNIACDLALNDRIAAECPPRLREMGHFPGADPHADLPVGKKAEYYFDRLPDDPKPPPSNGGGNGGQSNKDAQGQAPGDNAQSDTGDDANTGDAQGDAEANDQNGGDNDATAGAGKSTSNDPRDGNDAGDDPCDMSPEDMRDQCDPFDPSKCKGAGDVLSNPALETSTQEEVDGEWRKIVSRTMAAAQQCGTQAGKWAEDAKAILETQPRVDWKSALMRFMQRSCADGFTYSRPNRRSAYRADLILPARRGRKSGHGAIILDTSGSMSTDDCVEVFNHLAIIFKSFPKASCDVFECDTAVHAREKTYNRQAMPPKKEDFTFKGRGGTDLTPAFQAVAKRGREFDWVIVLSDMWFDYPNMPNPRLPTLWVKARSTRRGSHHANFKPPFGICVEVQ